MRIEYRTDGVGGRELTGALRSGWGIKLMWG